ncbi:MAG: hypothetical protein ACFFG0_10695 [Candidatus Thorarchaeota archaeon]
MFQLPLEKLFNKYQIYYMQGIASGIPKTMLSKKVGNNTTKLRNKLFENFGFEIKDTIPMPIVMVMWSPFKKIHVFNGTEALPFFSAYYKMSGVRPPSENTYKEVTKGLINIASSIDPKIPNFKMTPYLFWNNGPTEFFKEVFHLEDSETNVNFQALSQAVTEARNL